MGSRGRLTRTVVRHRNGQEVVMRLAMLVACIAVIMSHAYIVGAQTTNSANAQQTPSQSAADSLHQDSLTGDWGGERTKLEKAGIDLRAHFLTESAANPVGGNSQTARYTQQVDFGADIDLGRLIDLSGGRVQITFTDRAGRSLSADAIGNQFAVQELYGAGENFRLGELNYQQDFLDRKVTMGVGWSSVGDNFAILPILCDFQNVMICGHANAMSTNSGAENFPTGEWGTNITVRPVSEAYVATGVYQVNHHAGDGNNGLDLSFRGTGVFVPLELGWLAGHSGRRLGGTYKVGAYYNSSPTPDVLTDVNGNSGGLTGEPFMIRNGRWGAYAIADQRLSRPVVDSDRGLRIGGLVGIGDRQTSRYRYFWAGGGVYQGIFRRDNDFVSFAVSYARTNPRLTQFEEDRNAISPGAVPVQTFESIVEVDYNVRAKPWLSVRPNLQYVVKPNGTGKIPNAFVIGLHTSLTF